MVGVGGWYWHLVGRDRDSAKHPVQAQTVSTTKNYQPEMSIVPRLRNSDLDICLKQLDQRHHGGVKGPDDLERKSTKTY